MDGLSADRAHRVVRRCTKRRDRIDALKVRIGLVDLIRRHVELHRRGREYVGLCPFHAEQTPSFTVSEQKRFFHCFGCGAHGDVLDFVMAVERIDFPTALARVNGEVGFGDAAETRCQARRRRHAEERTHRAEIEERERRSARAREIFESAGPIEGTPAEIYLAGRGLKRSKSGWPESLRYLAAHSYWNAGHPRDGTVWPVLIAAVDRGPAGQPLESVVAVHRTYLKPDGSGKAPVAVPKKMLGPVAGGAIRFARPGSRLLVAEGIETALSVAQALPRRRVWAAGSLGNMAALAVPDGVRQVTLLMDADMKDLAVADGLLEKAWRAYGAKGIHLRVAWPPPGCDFNDVLTRGAPGWPGEAERKRGVR